MHTATWNAALLSAAKAMAKNYRKLDRGVHVVGARPRLANLRPHGRLAPPEHGAVVAHRPIRTARRKACRNAVRTARGSRTPIRGNGPVADLARRQEAIASAQEGIAYLARVHGVLASIGTADTKRLANLLGAYFAVAAKPDPQGVPNIAFLSRLASA